MSQDEVGRSEDVAQLAPTLNLLTLLMLAPGPVTIDPNIENLVSLATLFEALQVRTESFVEGLTHKGLPEECPAMETYVPAWMELVEKLYAEIDKVNKQAAEVAAQISEEMEGFQFVELRAIASCSKDDCKDRDQARELLGGFDEEGNERLM